MSLRPGTSKIWAANRRYDGVLRLQGQVVWTCLHGHQTSREALDCAWAELNRRQAARA